ncbi:MAG TPA: hypothetical protein VM266_00295 [Solirubrobacteraceae bacterium]|nr:hypothetical protein [Solirubrobacteraceae bacterium]
MTVASPSPAQTAARLASHADALQALARGALAALPREPRLHVKLALAAQAHADARDGVAILDRLADLPPAAPPAHGAPGDRAELVDALRSHLADVSPLLDLPTAELLVGILFRQRRALEAPVPTAVDAPAPARDAWIEIGTAPASGPGAQLHATLNAEVLAAEIVAQVAADGGQLAANRLADVARLADLHLQAAAAIERAGAAAGVHWGDHPVSVSPFARMSSLGAAARIELAAAVAAAARPEEPADAGVALLLEHLRANDIAHGRVAARWNGG